MVLPCNLLFSFTAGGGADATANRFAHLASRFRVVSQAKNRQPWRAATATSFRIRREQMRQQHAAKDAVIV
jgi:hypothetical protein